MAEIHLRHFSGLIALNLLFVMAEPHSRPTYIQDTERWDKSRVPMKISSVPQLTPLSTFTLQGIQPDGPEQIENIVLIDEVFVALTRVAPLGQRPAYNLRAFDLRTAKQSSSLDVSRPKQEFTVGPIMYASTRESVVLELEGSLFEYDKRLKLLGTIKLPKGRGVEQVRAYGYGDWTTVTATECEEPVAAFYLNIEEELITCGANEMGVFDQNGKLIFAEKYKRDRIADPQIAADGKRFVFELLDPDTSGDPPPPPWRNPPAYVLYDLHGDGPRRVSFSTLPRRITFEAATLSADGRTLALYSANRISLYKLPE
jgi:hypothetical protein